MPKQSRKPIKWVSSAKRDLDAMPEDVKDIFGLVDDNYPGWLTTTMLAG